MENGVKMIEFHVDSIVDNDAKSLHKYIEEATKRNKGMGANQSHFRKDKTRNVLIPFGQDECIFKQFLLRKKAWRSKSGKFKLTPKDDGSGIMVSALESRTFGFGFSEFSKWKEKINEYRKGKTYHDRDAADRVKKKTEKSDLDEDPFVR
eukprot:scaffold107936_cov28-Attheya_sp.AAC.1